MAIKSVSLQVLGSSVAYLITFLGSGSDYITTRQNSTFFPGAAEQPRVRHSKNAVLAAKGATVLSPTSWNETPQNSRLAAFQKRSQDHMSHGKNSLEGDYEGIT